MQICVKNKKMQEAVKSSTNTFHFMSNPQVGVKVKSMAIYRYHSASKTNCCSQLYTTMRTTA